VDGWVLAHGFWGTEQKSTFKESGAWLRSCVGTRCGCAKGIPSKRNPPVLSVRAWCSEDSSFTHEYVSVKGTFMGMSNMYVLASGILRRGAH
jgi:hypothetical protein